MHVRMGISTFKVIPLSRIQAKESDNQLMIKKITHLQTINGRTWTFEH